MSNKRLFGFIAHRRLVENEIEEVKDLIGLEMEIPDTLKNLLRNFFWYGDKIRNRLEFHKGKG